MENRLLITKITWESRSYIATALYHDNTLLEVSLEPQDEKSILGNIYVGKVKNIVKNINAAFIEIAPGLPCYYDLREQKRPLYVKKSKNPQMVQGDEVVVQVVRESSKHKPPKVSTNLSFSGKYLVLTSENTTLGISRKLNAEQREMLKTSFAFDQNSEFGMIVRTNAAFASEKEISEEYQRLKAEYDAIKDAAIHRTVFSCLKKEPPEYLHILQNLDERQMEAVITDDWEIYQKIQNYMEAFPKRDGLRFTFYEDKLLSLNKLYSLDVRLQEALRQRVWLKSGGYLVIQPTEALTVIDVNSGKSVSKKQVQEHYLKINLEAAEEIAHQLRLRNLSGIILVDFIDMKSEADDDRLMQALRAFVRADSVPVQVVDMTKLHLVELTRKKVKKPLAEQLCLK